MRKTLTLMGVAAVFGLLVLSLVLLCAGWPWWAVVALLAAFALVVVPARLWHDDAPADPEAGGRR